MADIAGMVVNGSSRIRKPGEWCKHITMQPGSPMGWLFIFRQRVVMRMGFGFFFCPACGAEAPPEARVVKFYRMP